MTDFTATEWTVLRFLGGDYSCRPEWSPSVARACEHLHAEGFIEKRQDGVRVGYVLSTAGKVAVGRPA